MKLTQAASGIPPQWAVAVIAARESVTTLIDVITSAAMACGNTNARIDVLINGNALLASALSKAFSPKDWPTNIEVLIWYFPIGDKAATWNAYIQDMEIDAELTFFLDGYARPTVSAFSELSAALVAHPSALAVTGIPTMGASADRLAKSMLRDGGIHGNMFALPRRSVAEFRRRHIRLPIGLYRVDSLIGAIINFNFDPAHNQWDPRRIAVQPSATWRFDPLKYWRPRDLFTQWKRRSRQNQGILENKAIRDFLALKRRPPEQMPETARELVMAWWTGNGGPGWWSRIVHPGWNRAYRKMTQQNIHGQSDFSAPDCLKHKGAGY